MWHDSAMSHPSGRPRLLGVVTHDLAALRAIYVEADRELAGWTCEQSTDCCRFGVTGREPSLWPNEWALVKDAIAARVASKPRRLPVVDQERRCPLLGDDSRCTIYDARPFGCRTYYCQRASGPTRKLPRDRLAELGRRVATLAERADPRGGGPRPLTSWLGRRT
jgi:hypothetical protein